MNNPQPKDPEPIVLGKGGGESQAISLDWTHVDSSNVDAVAFIEHHKTLAVRFRKGGLYTYEGPDFDVYASLVHAQSVGKYLNDVVKATYPYTRWDNEAELLQSLNVATA